MTLTAMPESPLPVCDPAEAGFIPERLAMLGPAMQQHIDRGLLPNAVTLVARHGRVVHFEARGRLAVDEPAPAGRDAIYRLFSNSKPVCGLATMMLFEEGRLSPDEPVSKYLPAFKNPRVRVEGLGLLTEPAKREITIRDCLRHTSGVASLNRVPLGWRGPYRRELEAVGWLGDNAGPVMPASAVGAATAREYAEALGRLPLSFHPGSAFEYHAGYVVAGAVIEAASGQSLEDFYRERIFEPLGMTDTSFFVDQSKLARFTSNHFLQPDGDGWKLTVNDRAAASEKLSGSGTLFEAGGAMGGGLASTSYDYARFGQMLLNGGELDGVRLVGRKTVEYMTTDHSEGMPVSLPGPGYGWGLGVAVRHGREALPALHSVGSYFWEGYAGTHWIADPAEDLQIICFTNRIGGRTLAELAYWQDCERIVYQSLA